MYNLRKQSVITNATQSNSEIYLKQKCYASLMQITTSEINLM